MNYKTFINSNTLKNKRIALGIRQQDVADILGFCKTDRISHWEKGRAIPSLPNLFLLCAIYKTYPHELYPELFIQAISEIEKKSSQTGKGYFTK